jgi:hypothetical protein
MAEIAGILDLLPRAKKTLNGKAIIIPPSPRNKVRSKPPHLLLATDVKPGPPYNKKKTKNG